MRFKWDPMVIYLSTSIDRFNSNDPNTQKNCLSFKQTCWMPSTFPQRQSGSEWMILKDVWHQHDSYGVKSVCSQALNELTFHEANGYWWTPACPRVYLSPAKWKHDRAKLFPLRGHTKAQAHEYRIHFRTSSDLRVKGIIPQTKCHQFLWFTVNYIISWPPIKCYHLNQTRTELLSFKGSDVTRWPLVLSLKLVEWRSCHRRIKSSFCFLSPLNSAVT